MSDDQSATDDYILLKWGTLKAWDVSASPASQAILRRYLELGTSMSAMAQRDTPEQKELICELLRQHQGTITSDWDGTVYTPEQAVDYVMNYPKSDS
jgi:hypothetical protein